MILTAWKQDSVKRTPNVPQWHQLAHYSPRFGAVFYRGFCLFGQCATAWVVPDRFHQAHQASNPLLHTVWECAVHHKKYPFKSESVLFL